MQPAEDPREEGKGPLLVSESVMGPVTKCLTLGGIAPPLGVASDSRRETMGSAHRKRRGQCHLPFPAVTPEMFQNAGGLCYAALVGTPPGPRRSPDSSGQVGGVPQGVLLFLRAFVVWGAGLLCLTPDILSVFVRSVFFGFNLLISVESQVAFYFCGKK